MVALQAAKFRPLLSGLVLIGGGVIPSQALAQLEGLPVRFVALSNYPASRSIERLLEYVGARKASELNGLDFASLHRRATPWPFGVVMSSAELRDFAQARFSVR